MACDRVERPLQIPDVRTQGPIPLSQKLFENVWYANKILEAYGRRWVPLEDASLFSRAQRLKEAAEDLRMQRELQRKSPVYLDDN